jgi:DNA-binding response OmpR family regulator
MPTILVVDDDPQLVEMLRMTLAYEGFTVIVAYDGDGAVLEARRSRPDLIVLDWLMPGRSGVEVAQELWGERAPPILMLTARDALEDRVEGLSRGADDYLVKPFLPPELLARVRALLRRTPPADRPLQFANLALDLRAYQAQRGDAALS